MNAAPPSPAPASASPQRQTSSLSRPQTTASFARPLLVAFSRTYSLFLRRLFLQRFLSLTLFAIFSVFISLFLSPYVLHADDGDDANLSIVTFTELHSANYLWTPGPNDLKEYLEFFDKIITGKANVASDLSRKEIGIAEKIELKIKGKAASLGDVEKVQWTVVAGGEWVDILKDKGETAKLGAKVKDGPIMRIVKIVASTTKKKKCTITITIYKPEPKIGVRFSRVYDAKLNMPTTPVWKDNVCPDHQNEGNCIQLSYGTWCILIPILQPGRVNFGGDHDGKVWIIEEDIASPPKKGTYSPTEPSPIFNFPPLYSNATHTSAEKWISVFKETSGFTYHIASWKHAPRVNYFLTQTCTWTCRWHWGKILNFQIPIKPNEDDFQLFEMDTNHKTTITKFGLTISRKADATTQTRTGIEWIPKY